MKNLIKPGFVAAASFILMINACSSNQNKQSGSDTSTTDSAMVDTAGTGMGGGTDTSGMGTGTDTSGMGGTTGGGTNGGTGGGTSGGTNGTGGGTSGGTGGTTNRPQ
jgi:hypothetical protein